MSDEDKDAQHKEGLLKRMLRGIRPATRTELAEVIAEAGQRDVIDEDTEDMLKGVFSIASLRVSDIMIPRSEMVTIDAGLSLEEIAKIIADSGHSRYPVTQDDKDHLIGILNAKDLIPYACGLKPPFKNITEILRPCTMVPETLKVDSLLKQFQDNHLHLAAVIDEFGGICGLITIEDILEVIVGDIADEYDDNEDESLQIVKTAENTYEVDGLTTIDDFNIFFNCSLPSPDVDTIAGLVIHSFGHIPHAGEELKLENFDIKILKASLHQVTKIQVKVLPKQEDLEEA